MTQTFVFEVEKTTKRMYRFRQAGTSEDNPADCDIGVIYVKKEIFGEQVPSKLLVTLSTEGEEGA